MTDKINIFWFRQDLRISDNSGLYEAAKNGKILAIYILDDTNSDKWAMGSASKIWLHNSLISLNKSLNNQLNLYIGSPKEIIPQLIEKYNANEVYWNRCYEPYRIKQDSEIEETLHNNSIECQIFNGSLLWQPEEILKKDSSSYKVFTPYYRHGCLKAKAPREPLPEPKQLQLIIDAANKCSIDELNLLPSAQWHKKLTWKMGEKTAQEKLFQFLDNGLMGYAEGRNNPYKENISKLSPHIHFGEISPNQIWYNAQTTAQLRGITKDLDVFLTEIAWREFSYYLLYHFPELPNKNFQNKFDHFPWQDDEMSLKQWQQGKTGYPIIDAGMRELWQTGFMHNRVRMIAASFLVKNLLIHWQHGAKWFWECLLDADLASNSASWQWVAGSGADAAPYFRVFNPILQGEKFDPHGEYTRKYLPELAKLPNKYLFSPWKAPADILKESGIALGENYPRPIVDLAESRDRALKAYFSTKRTIDF